MAIHFGNNSDPNRILAIEKMEVERRIKSIKNKQKIAILGNLLIAYLKNSPNPSNLPKSLIESPSEIIGIINNNYQKIGCSTPLPFLLRLQTDMDALYIHEEDFGWIEGDAFACYFVWVCIRHIGLGFRIGHFPKSDPRQQFGGDPLAFPVYFPQNFYTLDLPSYGDTHEDRISAIKKFFDQQVHLPVSPFIENGKHQKHLFLYALHDAWVTRFSNLVKRRSWQKKGVGRVYLRAIDFIFRQPISKIPPIFLSGNFQKLPSEYIRDLGFNFSASNEAESELSYYGFLWLLYGHAPGVSMLDIHKECDKYCTQIVNRELDARNPQRIADRKEKSAGRKQLLEKPFAVPPDKS